MIDRSILMKEIPQPLWDNWYITDDDGSAKEFYRVEAKRGGRTDISTLKVQFIVLDEEFQGSNEQCQALLEQKRQEAVNETAVMYKLKNCPYIVGYDDENILPLQSVPGYAMLIRMEYIMELPELIKKGGFPPTEDNVLRLAGNIGRGLNAAHKQGVHHRDIKPSNFFAAPDGTFKLGDFNISGSKESSRTDSGTAGYIAPEIYNARGESPVDYTDRADIYSFGICLYQLMNDFFFPFEEDCTTEQAVARRMHGEPLPVPKKSSPDLGRIILRACAFDPAMRYNSMDEMLCDIENLRAVRSAAAHPAAAFDSPTTGITGTVLTHPMPVPQQAPVSAPFDAPTVLNQGTVLTRSMSAPQQAPVNSPFQPVQKTEQRGSSKLLPILIIILIISVIALIIVILTKDNDNNNDKQTSSESVHENIGVTDNINSVEPYDIGDANGDGIISGSDATLILSEYTLISSRKSSFDDIQNKAADVDGDGKITGSDAAIVLRYYTVLSAGGRDKIPPLTEWLSENG